jgi:hypothetical protein
LIRSLSDVESYSYEHAKASPRLSDDLEFRSPGLSDLEAKRLQRMLPGLPDDYVDIIRIWRFDSVSIGYFNLQPPTFMTNGKLLDRLLAANSPVNPGFGTLKALQVLETASYEGDSLSIGARGTGRAGHVFRLALSEDPEPRLRFVASTFENLLKAATQLDVYRAAGLHGSKAIEEFLGTIGEYTPDIALKEWRSFAGVALQAG